MLIKKMKRKWQNAVNLTTAAWPLGCKRHRGERGREEGRGGIFFKVLMMTDINKALVTNLDITNEKRLAD